MIKNIYIHIPFCNNICTYCDFCKTYYNKKWIKKYLDSLKNEVNSKYKNETIETIYIGGGTPSSLSILELEELFKITSNINLDSEYEFTIECNIEDISLEKLRLFKKNKVNRLSIGIQSFNDKILKYLGRSYNSSIIFEKINLAKKYFTNINVDLIYAVKDEKMIDIENDIDKFLSLDIPHISCYSLIIEDNTILSNNNEKYINEDIDRNMYDLIVNKLSIDYTHYEISNFAKKGYESKHNLCYWNNKEYYGFGLSSSSYIKDYRYTNTKNLFKYMNNIYDDYKEYLTKEDKIKYELILGFRMINGINKKEFREKYNKNLIDMYNIKELIEKGILNESKTNIYINQKYIYVSNQILVNFV